MTNEATLSFIRQHQDDNPQQLALRGCKDPAVDFRFALQQIQGRQKAEYKLPDLFATPNILYPPTISLEQCSSTVTAAYKAELIQGQSIIDFSGGFGIDTFAFARKFQTCHYIEPQTELCNLMEHNSKQLGINNINVHLGTMEDHIDALSYADVIFVDPSRRNNDGNRVISIDQCSPNIILWKDKLLQKAETVMVKLSPMIDLKQSLRQLPETNEVHVVAVNGECKEILLLLSRNQTQERIFHTINFKDGERQVFTFSEQEELNAIPEIATETQKYLFEPNAAIMKSGAFKIISIRFNLNKLHPHSHLYFGDNIIPDFPGRIFTVHDVFSMGKESLKTHLSNIKQANVAVRNFPLTADELKKRLHMKDGGNVFLFGTTWKNDEKVIILSQKA